MPYNFFSWRTNLKPIKLQVIIIQQLHVHVHVLRYKDMITFLKKLDSNGPYQNMTQQLSLSAEHTKKKTVSKV